jgi:hypothetical protein
MVSKLIITGIIDGPLSGGTPKAIELYALDDLNELNVYGLGSANNGGGSAGEEFTLSGSASAGDFLYIASEDSQFNSFLGFTPNYTSGAANINGDDAIELFQNGTVVDTFGDINTDGTGQPWEYTDGWAYRNDNTTNNSIFDLDNWIFSGADALDGETTNTTAASPFPVGTFDSAATAAVPFEFSPTLGLLFVGSIAGICYLKKKTKILIKRQID